MVPVAWVVVRLLSAEHPRYGNLQVVTQHAQDHRSHQEPDQFISHEPLFKAHYESRYRASGYDYHHYRLAYTYGFDLALDPDHQKMGWKNVEPQARQNWNEGLMGQWSQHHHAILYGWEQGLKLNGG